MNTQPLQAPPRSGDQVITTMAIVMPVVSLLSPFLSAGIAWVGVRTMIVFPDGYQNQLESVIGSGIALLVAWLRMRHIRNETPTPVKE